MEFLHEIMSIYMRRLREDISKLGLQYYCRMMYAAFLLCDQRTPIKSIVCFQFKFQIV